MWKKETFEQVNEYFAADLLTFFFLVKTIPITLELPRCIIQTTNAVQKILTLRSFVSGKSFEFYRTISHPESFGAVL